MWQGWLAPWHNNHGTKTEYAIDIYIYICVINYIFHAHVLVSISKANAN